MSNLDLLNALLIDSHEEDRIRIRQQLELMGLHVFEAPTSDDAMTIFREHQFSIVLIDITECELAFLHLCQFIRAHSTVPIITLVHRDEHVDEELILDAGADDYVLKPVVGRLLNSRVTHQVRRGQNQDAPHPNSHVWGVMELNPSQHSFRVYGREVLLTHAEFEFLNLLMSDAKRVFTRDQIVEAMGAYRGLNSDHLVDTHASRLRKKIREAGGPEVISAVRSVGFRLAAFSSDSD